MIIIYKDEGTYIPYEVEGTKIIFDDDLSIKLAKREQDWPVHIDICYDRDGELVVGTGSGWSYVAQIDIPARRYQEIPGGEGEEPTREPIPLDMDTVTLTLWAI